MKVTLTTRTIREQAAEYGNPGQGQEVTLTLEGTPAEIQAGIEELLQEKEAISVRRTLGLKAPPTGQTQVQACNVVRALAQGVARTVRDGLPEREAEQLIRVLATDPQTSAPRSFHDVATAYGLTKPFDLAVALRAAGRQRVNTTEVSLQEAEREADAFVVRALQKDGEGRRMLRTLGFWGITDRKALLRVITRANQGSDTPDTASLNHTAGDASSLLSETDRKGSAHER